MKLIIDENNEGQRIDIFLSELMSDLSRSKIQTLIKDGFTHINNKNIKPSYTLKVNDIIEFNEELQTKISTPQAENIPLEIIWEDENMAVINKPSGMLTHPTTQEISSTLVNALLYKYGENLLTLTEKCVQG